MKERLISLYIGCTVLLGGCMNQPKHLIFRGDDGQRIEIGKDPNGNFFGIRLVSKEGASLSLDFVSQANGKGSFPRLHIGEKKMDLDIGYFYSISAGDEDNFITQSIKHGPSFGLACYSDNTVDRGMGINGLFSLGYSSLSPLGVGSKKKDNFINSCFGYLGFDQANSSFSFKIFDEKIRCFFNGKDLYTLDLKKKK